MSFSDLINKRKKIKFAKEVLTEREFKIYKALCNNPLGLTKDEIRDITGYTFSGWVVTSFKEKGFTLHNYSGVISLEQA